MLSQNWRSEAQSMRLKSSEFENTHLQKRTLGANYFREFFSPPVSVLKLDETISSNKSSSVSD